MGALCGAAPLPTFDGDLARGLRLGDIVFPVLQRGMAKEEQSNDFVDGKAETEAERRKEQRLGAVVLIAALFGTPIVLGAITLGGLALIHMFLRALGLFD